MYIVQEFAMSVVVNFGIKDFGDFVFEFSFDFNQRWGRLGVVRNFIWDCWFEL